MKDIKELINNKTIQIDKSVIVGTTKEYDLFQILSCNREINRTNVNNIKKSIQDNGYCKCNEVIVDEFWNIIDGQHTFTACKELGLEIRFKMIEGIGIETITTLNTNQRNWNNLDFIKYHVDMRNEDYIMLYKIINNNQDIPMSQILILMFNSRGKAEDSIKDGTFTLSEEILERFYVRLNNYRELVIKYKDRFTKKYTDDTKKILELLDNDFMSRMLQHVFEKEPGFEINLGVAGENHMKLIADKIAATF